MIEKVTDEMLMAYVDGELDPAAAEDVRRAAGRDTALTRRADEFRTARQWTKDAFAGIKAEPAPDRLVAAILGNAASNVVPFRRRTFAKVMLPLAASVALLFGVAGYWLGQQQPHTAGLFADPAIAQALGETRSGETRIVRTAAGEMQLQPLATYKVDGGHCRSFNLARAGEALRGVGCTRGGGWRVEMAVAAPASGGYAPASADAFAAIDAYLDAAGAETPLSAEEESALQSKAR